MDEVPAVPTGTNKSGPEWLNSIVDDDYLPIPLDASEGGLFSGNFIPPPPRPIFLDDRVTPDGLTTCDLCSWAFRNVGGGNAYTFEAAMEASGELGWVLTLVIVSVVSAVIGAIVMIIVLHCKRLKNSEINESEPGVIQLQLQHPRSRPPIDTPEDKTIGSITPPTFPNPPNANTTNAGVWSWLSRRGAGTPSQLDNPPSSPVENHYTHMDDSYNSLDDALYAELDRKSAADSNSNTPAYQNSGYSDPDAPSAPSSAYYSDLSITTIPDRAYEVVGLVTLPPWDTLAEQRRNNFRLAAISENVSVPSDYV